MAVGVSFLLMEELLPGRPWTGDNQATKEEKAKSSSSIEVSAVASDRFIVLDPEGPFDNSIAYYTAFAEQYLTLIADGQLYTEYYPVDAYLVYRFLKGLAAARLGRRQDTEAQTTPGEFFLKHVDENLHITGVIDWQMARVVPPQEAFGPSLATADMSALCDGVKFR